MTLYGHEVKRCAVKLKPLKLTPELIYQVYWNCQKLKNQKTKKSRKKHVNRGLLYECSGSEDEDLCSSQENLLPNVFKVSECDGHAANENTKEHANAIRTDPVYASAHVKVEITPEADEQLPAEICNGLDLKTSKASEEPCEKICDQENNAYPGCTFPANTQNSHKQTSKLKGTFTLYGYEVKQCSVKLKRLKLTTELVDQLYTYRQKLKRQKASLKFFSRKKPRHMRLLYECSSSEDEDLNSSQEDEMQNVLKVSECSGSKQSTTEKFAKYLSVPPEGTSQQLDKKPTNKKKSSLSLDNLMSRLLSEHRQSDGSGVSDDSRSETESSDFTSVSDTKSTAQNSKNNSCDFEDYLLD